MGETTVRDGPPDATTIWLHLLGPVDVRVAEGSPRLRPPLQPKRAAMLAWLALGQPRGRRSRATLCALFWPELDDARARRALNQALHYLRHELGDESFERHGDDQVGLSERVWCDALAFEAALDAGRHEAALLLYRGDLLDGMRGGSDLVEFERWADDERARLRARAAQGAWTLADQAAATNPEAALAWAQRAAGLGPELDEPSVRRLIATYDRCGDRAGAIRVFERFAERLRQEFETDPDPETLVLMRAIRARSDQHHTPALGVPPTAPAAVPALRDPGPDGPPPPRNSDSRGVTPRHSTAPSRRIAHVVLAVGGLLCAVAVWFVLRPKPPQSGSVAVFPFGYTGAPDQAHLAAAVVTLVGANLDGSEGLQSIDPAAIASAVAGEVAPLPRDRAEAIARRLGAAAFVLGEVAQVGDRVRVVARLHAASGWGATQSTAEGTPEELFSVVDRLTGRMLTDAVGEGEGAGAVRTAARTTSSLPALRAYLGGEVDLRAGRFGQAAESFRRAVAIDSNFALAYLRLGIAANWVGAGAEANWAAARAMSLRERLGAQERRHVEAWDRYLRGDFDDARRLYGEIVGADSADIEGWLRLGEIAYHSGGAIGEPVASSRRYWERVVALDRRNASALTHLARLAARDRRRADFDTLAAVLEALDPDTDQRLELAVIRAYAFGNDADRAGARGWLLRIEPVAVRNEFINEVASLAPDRAATADNLYPTLFVGRSPTSWEGGLLALAASAHLARGRLTRAMSVLDSGMAREPARVLEFRTALAIGGLPGLAEDLPSLRAQLSRDEGRPFEYWLGLPWRLYMEGMAAVRLGDSSAAHTSLRRLRGLRTTDGRDITPFGHAFARRIDAELAAARGDAAGALALLGPATIAPEGRPRVWSQPGVHERLLRARLLELVGRPREALPWYESIPDPSAYDLAYVPLALAHRIRLHRVLGEAELAAALAQRLDNLLRDADPAYAAAIRRSATGSVGR